MDRRNLFAVHEALYNDVGLYIYSGKKSIIPYYGSDLLVRVVQLTSDISIISIAKILVTFHLHFLYKCFVAQFLIKWELNNINPTQLSYHVLNVVLLL